MYGKPNAAHRRRVKCLNHLQSQDIVKRKAKNSKLLGNETSISQDKPRFRTYNKVVSKVNCGSALEFQNLSNGTRNASIILNARISLQNSDDDGRNRTTLETPCNSKQQTGLQLLKW